MKRFFKQFRYGEKGFTLIELLVVIAILGVLAAVAVPNIGKFLGRGTVEAANTEAHNVQTAVMAAMVDVHVSSVTATVGDGNEVDPVAPGTLDLVAGDDTPIPVKDFIIGGLQASYTIGTRGEITAAQKIMDSKWGELTYTVGAGWQ